MRQTVANWRTVRLAECCEIISGATPRRENPRYWNGTIRWATPKDISRQANTILTETAEHISAEGLANCSARLLPPGTILFSSRAPIGLTAIAGLEMCTNQGFKSLIPRQEITSEYLFWTMRHLAPAIDARASGTTFKEVSKADMEDVEIPLPPLAEQRRIAAILDKADALRRKRQEAIALTEQLLRSTFLEMFGDPVTNPKRWPTTTLGQLIPDKGAIVDGPFGSSLKPEHYVESGVRVVRNFNGCSSL